MKEKVVIVNPYNKEHIRLLEEYEVRNKIIGLSKKFQDIATSIPEEQYKKKENESAQRKKTLFLLKYHEVLTCAHLMDEKDRKSCRIKIDTQGTQRQQEILLDYAINYAFEILGTEEIFFLMERKNNISPLYLQTHQFEDLDLEEGMHIFMKSKEKENCSTNRKDRRG